MTHTDLYFAYTGPGFSNPRVGPHEDGYVYRIGNKISVQYHNAASARQAARKPQTVGEDGRLKPVIL